MSIPFPHGSRTMNGKISEWKVKFHSIMTTKASKKADEEVKDDQKEKQLYSFLFVLIGLTLWTRFHKISQPPWVCWDETHFGKLNVLWFIQLYNNLLVRYCPSWHFPVCVTLQEKWVAGISTEHFSLMCIRRLERCLLGVSVIWQGTMGRFRLKNLAICTTITTTLEWEW